MVALCQKSAEKKIKPSLHLCSKKGITNILGFRQGRANFKAECYLTFPIFQKPFTQQLLPVPIANAMNQEKERLTFL